MNNKQKIGGAVVAILLAGVVIQKFYRPIDTNPPAETSSAPASESTPPATATTEMPAPKPVAAPPITVITKEMRDAPLQKKDYIVGSGHIVVEGSKVTFNILVKLTDGKVVMDSKKEGTPWKGAVGDGSLITGIDQLIRGMYPGGKRAMWIPAHLAYGANGINGQIPPNSRLYAEVDLISVF